MESQDIDSLPGDSSRANAPPSRSSTMRMWGTPTENQSLGWRASNTWCVPLKWPDSLRIHIQHGSRCWTKWRSRKQRRTEEGASKNGIDYQPTPDEITQVLAASDNVRMEAPIAKSKHLSKKGKPLRRALVVCETDQMKWRCGSARRNQILADFYTFKIGDSVSKTKNKILPQVNILWQHTRGLSSAWSGRVWD